MRREGILMFAGVAAAALAGGLVAGFVLWRGQDEADVPLPREVAEIEAEATLSTRAAFFGDTVLAHVDVLLDRTRVDPESIRVSADFVPFEAIGRPERRRRDAGDRSHVRMTFVLRCLSGACVPAADSERVEFLPARVSFAAPSEQGVNESSLPVQWPSVVVFPRFDPELTGGPDGIVISQPWRADLLSLPSVSYRRAPGLVAALLLSSAALLVFGGIGLAYLAWPKRAPAPPPEPEPPPEPVQVLSPLEVALALLEQSIRTDGAADQRRALELVAEELELADWGDRELARTARALAWSEEVPPIDETSSLAARVRTALPVREERSENGDGSDA
jgi:hypothetical protein